MQEIIVERFDAWTSSLFFTQNPSHDDFKQPLLDLIEASKQSQAEVVDSLVAADAKHNLFESDLKFLQRDDEVLQAIKLFVESAVMYAAYEANHEYWPEDAEYQAEVVESWYHVTENGGYHDAHSHPNCSWCGIYVVDAGESDLAKRNGVNRFYDPRVNAGHFQDLGTQYLNQEGFWDIGPEDGHIVIFPSYLKHSALPYFGSRSRIVIAFNCVIQGS